MTPQQTEQVNFDYLITEDGSLVRGQYLGRHADDIVNFHFWKGINRTLREAIRNSPEVRQSIYNMIEDQATELEKQIKIERKEVIDWFDTNWKSANLWKKEEQIKMAHTIKPGFKEYKLERIREVQKFFIELKKQKNSTGWVEPELIDIANEVPIDSLMDLDRGGKALCLWHDEDTPSLSYKKDKNYVRCFGQCGKSFGAIDVYMKIHNVDFVTAVKSLTNNE